MASTRVDPDILDIARIFDDPDKEDAFLQGLGLAPKSTAVRPPRREGEPGRPSDSEYWGICHELKFNASQPTCHGKVVTYNRLSPNGHRVQHSAPPGHQLLRSQQCRYVTQFSSNLKRHQFLHTSERPYQCSHCDKAFVRKGHLVGHVRVHTGERPYQCSHCGKAFGDKSNLAQHVRIHTGERPYQCHLCPRDFTQKSALDSHVHSHMAGRLLR